MKVDLTQIKLEQFAVLISQYSQSSGFNIQEQYNELKFPPLKSEKEKQLQNCFSFSSHVDCLDFVEKGDLV